MTMPDKNDTALNLYIPSAVREKLQAIAVKQDRSMSYIVRQAIEEYINKHNERGE